MSDNVKTPSHYTQFVMQPIEFVRANVNILNPLQANIIKYICRYKLKNGMEDLLKARNYLDMLIEDWKKEHPEPLEVLKAAAEKVPVRRCPARCSSECTGRCAGCDYIDQHPNHTCNECEVKPL